MTEIAIPGRRIVFFDNARALTSVLVIVFHAAMAFSGPWVVDPGPDDASAVLGWVAALLGYFIMPIFLLVAGYFSVYGIERYGSAVFVRRRARRIGLPFLVSSILLIPVHAVVRWRFRRPAEGLSGLLRSELDPLAEGFSLYHLWFLYYVLVFSLLLVALVALRARLPGTGLAGRFWSACHRRFATTVLLWATLSAVLLVVGLGLERLLDPPRAWLPLSNFGRKLPMFLCGGYLYRHPEAMVHLVRPGRGRLAGGAAAVALLLGGRLALDSAAVPLAGQLLGAYDLYLRWTVTLGVLVLLARYAASSHRFLGYLAQAAYPVYIVHHPVVVVVAYLWLTSPARSLPAVVGFGVVTAVSISTTYLAYELLVRRNRLGTLLLTGTWRSRSGSA